MRGDAVMKKKLMAIVLCSALIFQAVSLVAFGAGTKNYIITDPYAEVDWDSWGAYKFQPHSHTTASDGFLKIDEYVQKHYDLNYDIVALTDHGTLNKGWNKMPDTVPLIRLVKRERTKMEPIVPLSDEVYYSYINGTAPSPTRTKTNGMLDVPLGIELNMATPIANCHLTGYFSTYGQGLAGVFGDYETPARGVKNAGGISMLAHVGEYVYINKDTEKHVGKKIDEYYVNKFARIFLDNQGSCVGMGINSATDAHTRCDRILYDQILQKTIPNGVVPWGFSFADSHNERSINDAYTMVMMPELSLDGLRYAMVNGHCFAVSHYSNGVELNGMEEIPGFDEQRVYDEELYLLDNTPMVTRITVDQENDTITVEGTNFNQITWVSNGNVILREGGITDGKATLDLHSDNLLDEPYLYVRFYITGENGICYSQPFVLNVEGEEFEPVEVPVTQDISTALRALINLVDLVLFRFNPLIWLFKKVALGYSVFEGDRLNNPY